MNPIIQYPLRKKNSRKRNAV